MSESNQPQNEVSFQDSNPSNEDLMNSLIEVANIYENTQRRRTANEMHSNGLAFSQREVIETDEGTKFVNTSFSKEGYDQKLAFDIVGKTLDHEFEMNMLAANAAAANEMQQLQFNQELQLQQMQYQYAMQGMQMQLNYQQQMFGQYLGALEDRFNRVLELKDNMMSRQLESIKMLISNRNPEIQAIEAPIENSILAIPEAQDVDFEVVSSDDSIKDVSIDSKKEYRRISMNDCAGEGSQVVSQIREKTPEEIAASAPKEDIVVEEVCKAPVITETKSIPFGDSPMFVKGPEPLNAPGWIIVPYADKITVRSAVYQNVIPSNTAELVTDAGDEVLTSELVESHHLEVYKHIIPTGFSQVNPNGELYWDAFDIPFNPQWKLIVAKCLKGLTNATFCIVRLLVNDANYSGDYLTLYVNNTQLSQYFKDVKDKFIQENANSIPYKPSPIIYRGDLRYNENFCRMMSVLSYAWQLNRNKPFVICEQIADRRHNGEKKLLLSNEEPKTEVTTQYNIFKNSPECVYTNYRTHQFMCAQLEDGGYSILPRR